MDKKGSLFYSGYSGLTYNDIGDFIGKEIPSTETSMVDTLIESIEFFIAKQCGRNFLYDLSVDDTNYSYYETFDAGNVQYYPFNYPVKEVTKIELDGVSVYELAGNNNTYELNVDFFVNDEKIAFTTIPFSSIDNRNALKIYYNIEEFWGGDVKLAIKKYVSQIYTQREYGGKNVTSFNFAGYSIDFAKEDLPAYVVEVINNYKKIII